MGEAPACVVFGGSGAVGREVCRALLARGARVAFTFFSNQTNGIDAISRRLDVTDVRAIERTLDDLHGELGRIDAFVNCAAVGTTVPHDGPTAHHLMADVDEGAWDAMIDVNAKGSFFAVRRVSALMRTGCSRTTAPNLASSRAVGTWNKHAILRPSGEAEPGR